MFKMVQIPSSSSSSLQSAVVKVKMSQDVIFIPS